MDKDATEALMLLLEQGMSLQTGLHDWSLEKFNDKNVLFFKGKNYIPRNDTLRRDIAKMFHDHETAGHPGELETYNAIRQHYWWPGLRTFVKNYVKGCGVCQQFKIDRHPSKPAYLPTEAAKSTRPFANCSMNSITDLPPADSFDSILVVVDQGLTKGGNSHALQQNDYVGRHSEAIIGKLVQTVRIAGQNYLGSRSSIRIESIFGTDETIGNQISTIDGISPAN